MSDDSRTVPQEQLPSDDLHPPPMPVINVGHLNLDPATRARMVEDITKACRDLGYFQVYSLRALPHLPVFFFSAFALAFIFSKLPISILQIINHGISQSVMDGAVEAASDFFKHLVHKLSGPGGR